MIQAFAKTRQMAASRSAAALLLATGLTTLPATLAQPAISLSYDGDTYAGDTLPAGLRFQRILRAHAGRCRAAGARPATSAGRGVRE